MTKEPIQDIRKSIVINSLKMVTNNKDICIYNIKTNKIRKRYVYKFESLKADMLRIDFVINRERSKILVNSSTGDSSPAIKSTR